MKKKEKVLPKIVAWIALLAIVIWIIGTGVLIVFESFFNTTSTPALTQEELQQYLDSLSWATLSGETLPPGTPETGSGS